MPVDLQTANQVVALMRQNLCIIILTTLKEDFFFLLCIFVHISFDPFYIWVDNVNSHLDLELGSVSGLKKALLQTATQKKNQYGMESASKGPFSWWVKTEYEPLCKSWVRKTRHDLIRERQIVHNIITESGWNVIKKMFKKRTVRREDEDAWPRKYGDNGDDIIVPY